MTRILLVILAILAVPLALRSEQVSVRVEPSLAHGPLELKDQTATAAIRDYLESWKTLKTALNQNHADILAPDFVGLAQDKLSATIRDQQAMGIQTRYRDLAHDIQIVFYSPEGASIQLTDRVEYDEQVTKDGKVLANRKVHTRYLVVLTPGAARWRVRIFQALPE